MEIKVGDIVDAIDFSGSMALVSGEWKHQEESGGWMANRNPWQVTAVNLSLPTGKFNLSWEGKNDIMVVCGANKSIIACTKGDYLKPCISRNKRMEEYNKDRRLERYNKEESLKKWIGICRDIDKMSSGVSGLCGYCKNIIGATHGIPNWSCIDCPLHPNHCSRDLSAKTTFANVYDSLRAAYRNATVLREAIKEDIRKDLEGKES